MSKRFVPFYVHRPFATPEERAAMPPIMRTPSFSEGREESYVLVTEEGDEAEATNGLFVLVPIDRWRRLTARARNQRAELRRLNRREAQHD